ncbi:MAG TPA: hypothetical protein VEF53_10065 [Patescibacteria group bacterium]|nr:hypothetical protein [Patescibacteria group bacterium]
MSAELKNKLVKGVVYTFKGTFDVNLTLNYENETWSEWHILREFISNALDSVNLNTNDIKISIEDSQVLIHDDGPGYPLVMVKRIGASSKKNDPSTIGQFGEGSKMAMLTCLRKGIQVSLCSQNWLIIPKVVELEGQMVLMYDIYESDEYISGSTVIIEATPEIKEIVEHIEDYFLHYSEGQCLFGNSDCGIYPLEKGNSKLYNKGVYIREIDGIFSYAINIERLNRDRDLINHSDVAYRIRDIWENVNDKELIKQLLQASSLPSAQRSKLIEFYCSIYTFHPQIWSEAFRELHGDNACLFTDDFAEREATVLGFKVVRLENSMANILRGAGIRYDREGLADDFEFVFSTVLDKSESTTLQRLPMFAKLAGFDVPEEVKIFEEYKLHPDIPGLYDAEKQQIYLRKDLLKSDFKEALYVFLHETCHHSTGADDISREFADALCRKLAGILLKYVSDVGIEEELLITSKGIELPNSFSFAANEMNAIVIVAFEELIIKAAGRTLKAVIPTVDKPYLWSRRIILKNNRFVVPLPSQLYESLPRSGSLVFRVL